MATAAEEIAALRGQRPAKLADLLKHPQFSRLWKAMVVSSLGDWVGFVAVAALVTRLGGDKAGFAVAGVMASRLLPSVLFGPFAGVLVDRFDRKRLMIVADISRGVLYATMPLMPNLGLIYLLSFSIECFALVWVPAKDASIPNLVPKRQLSNANTVGVISAYGTLPLGGIIYTSLAGLAGALGSRLGYFAEHREFLALWLDGSTFLFSAYMVSKIAMRQPALRRRGEFHLRDAGRDIVEGVRFMREHALARAMLLGIVIAFTGAGSVMSLGPIFAKFTLHAGDTGWGILVTSLGLGMGIGMGGVNLFNRFADRETVFAGGMFGAAISAFFLAAMPTIALAALFTILVGVAAGLTWVSGYTMLQENIADEYRGRTFTTLTVLSRLGLFLSLAGFPLLAQLLGNHALTLGGTRFDLSGTRLALWLGGAVVFAAGIVSRRGLKRSRIGRSLSLRMQLRLKKPAPEGAFIAFEGVEGSGKGTQIGLTSDWLEREGRDVLVTREPGGTKLGELLRDAILSKDHPAIDSRAEALVFAASRAQHVVSVIRPALAEGKIVLTDRYVDSSLAYQGVARGLGEQDVLTLNAWATQGLFPDLVVLLHIEPEVGLSRKPEEGDRFETEDEQFHAKVSDAYLQLAEEHPERYVVIDADAPPEVVQERVQQAVVRFLKQREQSEREAEDPGTAGPS